MHAILCQLAIHFVMMIINSFYVLLFWDLKPAVTFDAAWHSFQELTLLVHRDS